MEFGEMKRNTSNWSNFCMLLRRAGFTASAGLSCYLPHPSSPQIWQIYPSNFRILIESPSSGRIALLICEMAFRLSQCMWSHSSLHQRFRWREDRRGEPTATMETGVLQLQVRSCGTAFQLKCDNSWHTAWHYTCSFRRFKRLYRHFCSLLTAEIAAHCD